MRISHSNILLSSALLISVVISFPHAVYAFRMLDFDPTKKDYAYREMQIRSRATALEQLDLPQQVADYRQEDNRREDNRREDNRREDNRREDNRLIENREFYRREDNRRIQEEEEAEAAAEQQSDISNKTGAARRLSAPSPRGRSQPDPQAVKRINEQNDHQVDLIRQKMIRNMEQSDRQVDLEVQRSTRDMERMIRDTERQSALEEQRMIRNLKQLEQPIESQSK